MAKVSAGLLLFRRTPGGPEVLLAHLGGPFFAAKDLNAWGVPKGEVEEGEDPLATAKREFAEETGTAPEGPFLPLDSVKQKSGKVVHAWAVEGQLDPKKLVSNTFEIEWPRGSGKLQAFPEIDRAEWFSIDAARKKIIAAQAVFLDRLLAALGSVS
jgi:predicted NUDIX family NTP pyrophosphohydrolase